VKFLSLAQEADADYLVTKDGRHLLRLKKFGRTQIVTPTRFLAALA
jgi:predicted nucleic acid-binding protein